MEIKPAGEFLERQELTQFFISESDNLSVIAAILATYRNAVHGALTITVHGSPYRPRIFRYRWLLLLVSALRFLTRPNGLGPVLSEIRLAGEFIQDNVPIEINIPTPNRQGTLYVIRMVASGSAPRHAATAWLASAQERIAGHVACFVGRKSTKQYGLRATLFHAVPAAHIPVPTGILYSPITQCNLNCIHCISRPTRNQRSRLPDSVKGRLRQLCDDGHVTFIATDYSGDILWADHRYGNELSFLFSLNVPFHIDTNGAYLTQEAIDRLMKSKLHSINISLDAATEETYKRVRKGAPPLSSVLSKIQALVSTRDKFGASFPISMGFTLMASSLHEWPDFIRMAAAVGVNTVYCRHVEAYTADMEAESLWNTPSRYNELRISVLKLADELRVSVGAPPPFLSVPARTGHMLCREPWRSAVILGNGDVAACCVPGTVMGNLQQNSLEEIWNGTRYQEFRIAVNSSEPPWPCKACPMFRLTENRDSYLIFSARQRQLAKSTNPSKIVINIASQRGLTEADEEDRLEPHS